jgi:hypothetical protein
MYQWLRRVTPDLFLAAVVALLLTLALHALDGIEDRRIVSDARMEAKDGLTFDERIDVLDRSIRRSVWVQLPLLVVAASLVVGLCCRQRRWGWLIAILAIVPTLLTGVSFFIDLPLVGSSVAATYIGIAVVVASRAVAIRDRVLSEEDSSRT